MPAQALRLFVILLLAASLAPPAAAGGPFPARLHLQSAQERVAGTLDVDVAGGGLLASATTTGTITFRGVTGTATLVATNVTYARVLFQHDTEPRGATARTPLALSNATVTIALADEPFALFATAARDGHAHATAPVDAAGRPAFLARDTSSVLFEAPVAGADPPPRVEWSAGQQFVGNDTSLGAPLPSFPAWDRAVGSLTGRHVAHVLGGNATIADANGTRRERLGSWTETQIARSPTDDATVETRTRVELELDATFASADIPLEGRWGLAGPSVTWHLDGRVAWPDATGRARAPEGERAFEREDVEGTGVLDLQAAPEGSAVSAADAHDAEGSWTSLRIGGATAAPPSSNPLVAPAIGVAAIALVGVAILLYTRIAPARVLDHERRARMYDVVRSDPGVHLRELHRQVGGAWGAFTFHLGMLAQAGLLRLERHGRYVGAFPAALPGQGPIVRHPVARRVRDALPADGSPVSAVALRERVGISRQLLSYHLSRLEAEGLVERAPDGFRLAAASPAPGGDAPPSS